MFVDWFCENLVCFVLFLGVCVCVVWSCCGFWCSKFWHFLVVLLYVGFFVFCAGECWLVCVVFCLRLCYVLWACVFLFCLRLSFDTSLLLCVLKCCII